MAEGANILEFEPDFFKRLAFNHQLANCSFPAITILFAPCVGQGPLRKGWFVFYYIIYLLSTIVYSNVEREKSNNYFAQHKDVESNLSKIDSKLSKLCGDNHILMSQAIKESIPKIVELAAVPVAKTKVRTLNLSRPHAKYLTGLLRKHVGLSPSLSKILSAQII